MDRQQKIERIASKGHVARISNLKVTHKRIHPDYACEPCDGKLGETGKLELLKVVPKSGEGPFFMARWDQKAEHLDIDMKNAANSAIRSFKKNRHGYRGHHTMRASNPNERVFDVKIETPNGVIFDGIVSFLNHYELIVEPGRISVTGSAPVLQVKRTEENG